MLSPTPALSADPNPSPNPNYPNPNPNQVRHAVANPEGKLHHSFLALKPAAARSARTVCHELTHCLQMHTGGHVNSEYVGYQWEAHAEYCVHR